MKTRRTVRQVVEEEVEVEYQVGPGCRKVAVGHGKGEILTMWVPLKSIRTRSDGTKYTRYINGHGDYAELHVVD